MDVLVKNKPFGIARVAVLLMATPPHFVHFSHVRFSPCSNFPSPRPLRRICPGASPRIAGVIPTAVKLSDPRFVSINALTKSSETTLHLSVTNGLADASRAIMRDPRFTLHNAADGGHKKTALHLAVEQQLADVAQALLDEPQFTAQDARDKDGRTALALAAALGDGAMCMVLLGNQSLADLDVPDALGRTVLHVAIERRLGAVCLKLLSDPRFSAVRGAGFVLLHLRITRMLFCGGRPHRQQLTKRCASSAMTSSILHFTCRLCPPSPPPPGPTLVLSLGSLVVHPVHKRWTRPTRMGARPFTLS